MKKVGGTSEEASLEAIQAKFGISRPAKLLSHQKHRDCNKSVP
jgi:hypothetical protein